MELTAKLTPGFIFDGALHAYYVNGRRVPGVSDILQRTGMIVESPFWTDDGRDKGKRLHYFCSQIDRGSLDWSEVDLDIADEVFGYEQWIEKTGYKAIFTEEPLYSEICNFAGTPDSFGYFPDKTFVLLDRKRRKAQAVTELQLAGYVQLICERYQPQIFPHRIKCFALENFVGGSPNIQPFNDRKALPVFLGLAAGVNWGLNKGIFTLNSQPLEA